MDNMMDIHVTDNAIEKATELGCSGLQYGFAFDNKFDADEDLTASFIKSDDPDKSIDVVIEYMSYEYLKGSTIDYVQNLQGAFFSVTNPNATTTCGCGNSFSV